MVNMNALEFAKHLRESSKRLQNNVTGVLYSQMTAIKVDLEDFSPVDKDVFRQSWRLKKISSTRDSLFFHMRIDNNTPYGVHVDQGVAPGEAPWYFPNKAKEPSGKLILRNGRVWAGGLSPSGFVVGGIVDKKIYYNKSKINKIVTEVADAVLGAL